MNAMHEDINGKPHNRKIKWIVLVLSKYMTKFEFNSLDPLLTGGLAKHGLITLVQT